VQAAAAAGGAWVGEFAVSRATLDRLERARDVAPVREDILDLGDSGFMVHGLLTPDERRALRDELADQTWVPVGRNGMQRGFDPRRDVTGSYRATSHEPAIAGLLWERLAGRIPMLRTMQGDTPDRLGREQGLAGRRRQSSAALHPLRARRAAGAAPRRALRGPRRRPHADERARISLRRYRRGRRRRHAAADRSPAESSAR
jgi:hypothetical protein